MYQQHLPVERIQQAIATAWRQKRLGNAQTAVAQVIYTDLPLLEGALPVAIARLNPLALERPSGAVLAKSVCHEIGTLLGGAVVLPSNHSGARYVIFPFRPHLPDSLPYPEQVPPHVFPLGVSVDERLHLHAREVQNILVGGAPGSGKSTFLRTMAITALRHGHQLYLADPQENTFSNAEWGAHTALPPAGSQAAFDELLARLLDVYRQRGELFAGLEGRSPFRNLDEYNRTAGQPLPHITVLVDEANTYLVNRTTQNVLADVTRQGRKYGVTVIVAAHDWRSDSIPKGLSANFRVRISFRTDDDTSGPVVLLSRTWGSRAMSLKRPGRGIGRFPGKGLRVFQAYLPPTMPPHADSPRTNTIPASSPGDAEFERVRTAAPDGEITIALIARILEVSEWQARKRQDHWAALGWIVRDGSNAYKIAPQAP